MNSATQAIPAGLPSGSAIEQIAYLSEWNKDSPPLMEFQDPRRSLAVRGETHPDGFSILMVPAGNPDAPQPGKQVEEWVRESPAAGPALMVLLHGAQVFWKADRAGLVVQPDRMEALLPALVEFTHYERALRRIETDIARGWPNLETDSPLAFEFNEQAVPRRAELSGRFQQAIALRAALSRLAPHLHRPALHPATLASQIGERLRERARLTERMEAALGQLEVVEKVYEMCAQRTSEFMLSHSHTILEWIIIILLGAETLLLLADLMATLGK